MLTYLGGRTMCRDQLVIPLSRYSAPAVAPFSRVQEKRGIEGVRRTEGVIPAAYHPHQRTFTNVPPSSKIKMPPITWRQKKASSEKPSGHMPNYNKYIKMKEGFTMMRCSDEPHDLCHSIIIDERAPRCRSNATHHPFSANIIVNRKSFHPKS